MATKPAQPASRQPRRKLGFILPFGLSIAMLFLGADIIPLAFGPLDYLGIPYPHAARIFAVIICASPIIAWFAFRRSEVAVGIALFLAIGVMSSVAHWADAQPATVRLTKWIDGIDLDAMKQRLGFKIMEKGNADGDFFLVARQNEQAAINEAKRLGVYRH